MRRSLMRRVRALGTFCSGHAFDYIGDRAIFVEPQSDSISQLSELAYLLLILQNAVGRCLAGKFPTASFDAAKRRVEVCRIQTCQQKVSPVKRRDLIECRNHIIKHFYRAWRRYDLHYYRRDYYFNRGARSWLMVRIVPPNPTAQP